MIGVVLTGLVLTAPGTVPEARAAAQTQAPIATTSEPSQMQDFNLAGYGTNGEKTWEVEGASMDMTGPDIKIRDITAHMYGKEENLVVTADNGHFDKESGVVRLTDNVRAVTDNGATLKTDSLDWSQKDQLITTNDKVNVTKDNITAQGQGLEAKSDMKVAKFEKDVIVTLEDQKKAKPQAQPAPNTQSQPFGGTGKLVITCDGPMELNYDKQFAIFNKNVKVESEGSQGTMIADKMTVRFDQAARQIDTINAEGHVQILRGDNVSYSDGAVFSNKDKRVVLTGRPKLVIYTDALKQTADKPEGDKAGKTTEKKTHVPPRS